MLHKYCTYLLTYKGNKLPPFYIGSGTIYKIQNEGYIGSVSSRKYKNIFRSEKKNNIQLFKLKILKTFKTRKQAYTAEEKLQKQLDVVNNPLYFNMNIANSKHDRGDVSKPIVQLTLTGEFIKEFKSSSQCERITGLKQGNINACLRKKTKQAFGYVWVYKKDYNKLHDYSIFDKIYQYSIDGKLVKVWKCKECIDLKIYISSNKVIRSQGYFWFTEKKVNEIGHNYIRFLIKEYTLKISKRKYPSKYYDVTWVLYNGVDKSMKMIKNCDIKNKKKFHRRYRDKQIIENILIFKESEFNKETAEQTYKKIKDRYIKNKKNAVLKMLETTRDKTPIVQLTLEGDYIKTYNGVFEVSKNTGIHKDSIRGCIHKKQKRAGDFQFFYESDYLKNKNIGRNKEYGPNFKYLILQVDKNNGNILKTFKSAEQAKKYFGSGDINSVLRNKQKTSNGSRWYEIKNTNKTLVGRNIDEIKHLIIRPKIK